MDLNTNFAAPLKSGIEDAEPSPLYGIAGLCRFEEPTPHHLSSENYSSMFHFHDGYRLGCQQDCRIKAAAVMMIPLHANTVND